MVAQFEFVKWTPDEYFAAFAVLWRSRRNEAELNATFSAEQ
jgi:hypothetical protein